jgi:uncharacterized membrane protein
MPIILSLFNDTAQAQVAVQALLANHAALQPKDIGIVSKSADGQIDFLENAEEQELHRLSTFGRVTGWLLGLAGAVVGAPFTIAQSTTAGDLLAGDLATQHDAGFSDDALRQLGEHLHAGSTAVVILNRREDREAILDTLRQYGGMTHQGELPPDIEAELGTGPD